MFHVEQPVHVVPTVSHSTPERGHPAVHRMGNEQQRRHKMTIQDAIEEIIGEGNYDSIDIHEGTSRANMTLIAEQEVDFDTVEARDYWTEDCSDGYVKLHILVQPER